MTLLLMACSSLSRLIHRLASSGLCGDVEMEGPGEWWCVEWKGLWVKPSPSLSSERPEKVSRWPCMGCCRAGVAWGERYPDVASGDKGAP